MVFDWQGLNMVANLDIHYFTDSGCGGCEDPEGGQLLRGEGWLPQRGRDDETFRSQGISRHFPHFSAGIWNLPPFPSFLCWNMESPAISLTSLVEFEISRHFPNFLLEFEISRHYPHFSAAILHILPFPSGIWNLPPFPSLLCWSMKSPAISLTYPLEFEISHHFPHLSAEVWNLPPFP